MPNKEYYKDNKRKLSKEHREYYEKNKDWINAKHASYREVHRLRINERQKLVTRENRKKVLEYYGNKCACCGESTFEFLAIDHIFGMGDEQRKKWRSGNFYTWIMKNNYPNDLQILCHNCNSAKGFYGKCPHQK